MKKIMLVLIGLFCFQLSASAEIYPLDTASSEVNWIASKVTGQHNGQIKIESGHIVFDKDKWVGGEAVIDMTSIDVKDIEDATYNQKLVDHLNSADFFDVEKFKTATITIEKVADRGAGQYEVTADITIKGHTEPVTFVATLTDEGGSVSAVAVLTLDRTKFDIKYGSGKFFDSLGDKLIHDEFSLTVSVKAPKG